MYRLNNGISRLIAVIIILVVFALGTAYGQNNVRIVIPEKVKTNATRLVIKEKPKASTSKQTAKNKKAENKKEEEKADTAYYTEITRRYSWIEGLGEPISKELASTFPYYYRFTMKNSKGHWQHIETMQGEEPFYHRDDMLYGYFPQFKYDYEEHYANLASQISQWFCFSNLDEEELLEERSYDMDGNLLFSAQFNRHPDGRIIIAYNGSNGFPVEYDESNDYTYGNVFAVTYDDNGYDSKVEYYDAAGFPRPSVPGSYQDRFKYDENGKVLTYSFHNQIGTLINNKAGFALVEITNKSGDSIQEIRILDKDGKPVKPHPEIIDVNFMISRKEYEETGRPYAVSFYIEEEGKIYPDEVRGVHKMIFDYSGEKPAAKFFDRNNQEIQL